MMTLLRRLVVSPRSNIDLVTAWLFSVAAHTLVPADHVLARVDLVPWTTLCMTVVAIFRALPLGDTSHPSLAGRQARGARFFGQMGLWFTPIALMLTYDLGGGRSDILSSEDLPYACAALWGFVLLLRWGGSADGLTSWDPRGLSSAFTWGLRGPLIVALAYALGAVGSGMPNGPTWGAAGLLGVQFLALGTLGDRVQVYRQRRASGRRDGRPYQPPIFRFVLASLGPSLGFAVLMLVNHLLDVPMTFSQSTVVSLHVFAWAAVIWPPRVPVAVSCLLHEVFPAAGVDPGINGDGASFDRPPTGALQLDPLGVRRSDVVHHWIVPVQDPRIESFDDPIKLLWARRPLPQAYHVLGEASFEPDAATQLPQWHTITLRLDEQRDVGRLSQSNVQTRRLSVLRPYPSRGAVGVQGMLRTYRWDEAVRPGTLQVVDATTEQILLQDGDLLVLSTEGVARAFELEIGAPIQVIDDLASRRSPHLEDYVGFA